ncbi:hypothetical protein ACLB2K_021758 [Fragaria x ananassa]
MGCTSSKYSSEGEAKGTTIVGLFYEGGILVAADSRSSNEKRSHKALQIKNNAVKMFPISSSIIAVISGTAIDCMTMCESVQTKYITESKKNGDSVHYALVQMCAHLRGLPEKIKKDKAFGVLLAGWDERYDLQLYRIFIKDGRVTNEQIYNRFAAMGSGSRYAESIVRLRFNSFPVFRRGGKVVRDAAGVFWGGGVPSPTPKGGERTDVRTLSRVRTSALHPL